MGQGFPLVHINKTAGTVERSLLALWLAASVIVNAVISGRVVSNMLRRERLDHVDSLEQLALRTDLGVLVKRNSFAEAYLRSTPQFAELEERILFKAFDTHDAGSLERAVGMVRAGPHVLVDDKNNFRV